MPVHLETHGHQTCVVEPDGTVVPSGCYDKRDDALSRLRAINANVEDKETAIAASDYTVLGDTASMTVSTDSTNLTPIDMETEDMAEQENQKEAANNKFGFDFIEIGPTSFSELDDLRESQKQDMGIKSLVSDFMAIVGNIMSFPSEKGKVADLRELIKEMQGRLPEEDATDSEDPMPASDEEDEQQGKDKGTNTEMVSEKRLFTIWKDEATGVYRWLGVYSNKFRDDDSPAEILAEKAHLRFIERVEKGELDYPDLYVWHIPVPVGKADLLAYDDAGFSIAAGTVKEQFAVALMNTSEDLAMSHGMPAKSIRRDESDKTVITDYVSTEVSVLPRWAAANKLTDFYVLNEEEAKMAIIPDEKRQQVADLLGTDLTEQLEAGLASRSTKAVADGVEFKAEGQPVEEAAETTSDATEVKTEEVVEENEETAAETVAEAEGVAEESVDESDAGAATDDVATEEPTLQKSEIVEAMALIVQAVTEQNEALKAAMKSITDRMDAIEGGVGDLQKSTEQQVAELAASTPEASLTAMLTSRLANVGSVIGNPATRVKETDALAKDGPTEAPAEGEEEGQAGLFFNSWQR